jgi:hypothetical protein
MPEANSAEQLLRLVDCISLCGLQAWHYAGRMLSRAKNSIRELHARGIVRLISLESLRGEGSYPCAQTKDVEISVNSLAAALYAHNS